MTYKPTKNTLKKHGILKRLSPNKDIVITRPYKMSGIVILDKTFYEKKILKLISDVNKFKELIILFDDLFDDNTYKKIYPSCSKPVTIYGLAKVHNILSNDFQDLFFSSYCFIYCNIQL